MERISRDLDVRSKAAPLQLNGRPTALTSMAASRRQTALPKRCQHHVNDDAGHRDVEPDRERESGQAAMGREAAGER
jgi:hypothetical protein